jgi:hypothetical protein
VLCPAHTCPAGEKECDEENTQCTTKGLGEEAVEKLVCPISTECIPEGCLCPIPGCEAFPLKCDECQIDQDPTPDCMICCPGSECEPNQCIPQEAFGKGTDGELCPAFCARECVPDENNICCTNEKEANGCLKYPGEEIETPKKDPECDINYCPCKCEDPETGECCAAPKDNKGCDMEEEICVEKLTNPIDGELCNVHCPLDVQCDPLLEIRYPGCEVCDLDTCCRKSEDFNGLFCPDDYDHGCGSCGCGCDDGLCCEGCVENLGCKPMGKCIPPEDIPKDVDGNDCPKESVCPCCCKENQKCCEQGIGPDGCKKEETCIPKMENPLCVTNCPCVDGLTCKDGEKCCPGHINEHGCEDPPVCTKCGTKTEGNCKGEACTCFCPASCELPLQIACTAQIDCDGCPEEEVCRTRAKNINGIFCDDDSASHDCPILCNEKAGEVDCIPEPDVLGCRGKAVCVQRKKDINGDFCPCATACPAQQCPEGGLDEFGCPLSHLCGAVEVPAPVPVEEPEEPAEEPAVVVVEAPPAPPAEAPAE